MKTFKEFLNELIDQRFSIPQAAKDIAREKIMEPLIKKRKAVERKILKTRSKY